MKLNKTLIVLLAIFMLTISAGVAFADENATTGNANENDNVAENGTDDNQDDVDENETGEDEELVGEIAPADGADDVEMLTSSIYEEPANTTDGANASASGASEVSGSSNLAKNPTANPLVILLAAIAGIGLTSIRIRK